MRLFITIGTIVAALAIPTYASAASTAYFKVSISGKQTLSWSVNGTATKSCQIVNGNGSGSSELRFKGSKSGIVGVSRSGKTIGNFFTKQKGTRTASYVETYTNTCGGDPIPSMTAPTSGCGDYSQDLNFSLQTIRGRTWLSPTTFNGPIDECAQFTNALAGDASDWAICNYAPDKVARGVGSLTVPLAASFRVYYKSMRRVKKGKKKTITASNRINCDVASSLSAPIKLVGEIHYRMVFKRTG